MAKQIFKSIGKVINFTSILSPKLAAHLSIKLFSTPQKGAIQNRDSKFLKNAIQEDAFYENIKIKTYRWPGNKDTVLLAHGWESNANRWKDLIEILKLQDYNIIALDAPAHGNSGNKTFNALIYSECIYTVVKKFNVSVIIGHSVGGMASVFGEFKHKPTSVKKLILLGAPADFDGVFTRYSQMMGYNQKVINAMNDYVLKHYNHLPEYYSAANFSKSIKAKGLIIHDKKDRIIPFSDGLNFKSNYSNSEFIATKGFGHGLKSEAIYNYILEFLEV